MNYSSNETLDLVADDGFHEESVTDSGLLDSTTEERDEKKEVYKMSAKDTFRVKLWRGAVTIVLLITALAVTLSTYKFLKAEEKESFEVAVSFDCWVH